MILNVCNASIFTGNYFNGGERHNPTFDTALDSYLRKSVREQLITDVVRFEYTNYKHPLNETPVYDRGSVCLV